MAHLRDLGEQEQRVSVLRSTCRKNTTTYAMKTELESASVEQLLGEDSDVSSGADEDCECADQDGLSMKT